MVGDAAWLSETKVIKSALETTSTRAVFLGGCGGVVKRHTHHIPLVGFGGIWCKKKNSVFQLENCMFYKHETQFLVHTWASKRKNWSTFDTSNAFFGPHSSPMCWRSGLRIG